MAQSGTVATGGSVDVVVAAYERLRIYDAGGLVGTLSRQNAGGGWDVIAGLDQWTTGEARGWGGPGTFRISVTAGAARYVAEQAALDAKLATGVRSICIPAVALTPRTTDGAAWGSVETATNKRMVRSLDFDAATAEYAQVCIPMPKSWDKGAFNIRVIWQPADSASGNVRWAARAAAVDFYDGTDHLDRAWGAAVAAASGAPALATATAYTDLASVSAAGTPSDNTLLFIEIYRDAADAADTYAADAKLLAVFVHASLATATDA